MESMRRSLQRRQSRMLPHSNWEKQRRILARPSDCGSEWSRSLERRQTFSRAIRKIGVVAPLMSIRGRGSGCSFHPFQHALAKPVSTFRLGNRT